MIVGTDQNAPTSSPKVVANVGGVSANLRTEAKPAMTNINAAVMRLMHQKLKEAQELNCALKDGYEIVKRNLDGHQQGNNSECHAVETRKDTSAQEKEKDLYW